MYTIQDGIGVLDGAPISINTRICQAIEIKKQIFSDQPYRISVLECGITGGSATILCRPGSG